MNWNSTQEVWQLTNNYTDSWLIYNNETDLFFISDLSKIGEQITFEVDLNRD